MAVAGGLLLLTAHRPVGEARLKLPRPEAKAIFDDLIMAAVTAARGLTDAVHNGSLQRGLMLAILVMIGLGLTTFLGGSHGAGARATLPVNLPALVLWFWCWPPVPRWSAGTATACWRWS